MRSSSAGRVTGYKAKVTGEATGEGTAMADVGTEESRGTGGTKELEAASTTVTTGGIDCETEPEREAVEGAACSLDADDPKLARDAAEVGVVDELSDGVNAGSRVVAFAGEAPALRVEGSFEVSVSSVRTAASLAVKESFWTLGLSLSLSLLPTDLAR